MPVVDRSLYCADRTHRQQNHEMPHVLDGLGSEEKTDKEETHTHTHNRFTALLESVRDHPGEQVPER